MRKRIRRWGSGGGLESGFNRKTRQKEEVVNLSFDVVAPELGQPVELFSG